MIENDFTISGTWEWRPEGSKEIAERFLDSLDALSAISPHFSSWKFTERNLEIEDLLAGEKPGQIGLEDVRNRFAEIVERGGQSDVAGNPLPQLGYQVSTWNGNEKSQIDPFSVTLRVQAGGDRTASRSVTFGTQYDQIPDPSIIAYPVFKATLLALADKWNVSGARAFSEELSQDWNYPALRFDLAWMTFLSAPLAAQIRPPSGIVSERTPGGGLLLVAAEETFDTGNPEHMEAARRIRDALAPPNDLERHAVEKRILLEDDRKFKATGFPGEMITNRRIPPFDN